MEQQFSMHSCSPSAHGNLPLTSCQRVLPGSLSKCPVHPLLNKINVMTYRNMRRAHFQMHYTCISGGKVQVLQQFAMAREKQALEFWELKKMVHPGFSFARVFLALVFSCCCIATEPQVPAIIVFGDSTADVGMNSHWPTLLRSNFAPYGENFEGGRPTGRFTDGQMIVDIIALKLGLPLSIAYLDPEATGERLLMGVNFASAGSGFLQSTSSLLNTISAFDQLQMFRQYQMKMVSMVGRERASVIISEAIFGLSTGTCNFILNYLRNPHLQQQYTPTEWDSFVLSNQTQFVKQLYKAGARKFLVYGLLPIGCLPFTITLSGRVGQSEVGCEEDLNQIGLAHNQRLRAAISQLHSDLPGIRILYGDAYTYLYEAFNNPSKYGYTETRRACCGEGLLAITLFCNAKSPGTCSDPSTFMFFDSTHPTENVYKAVAEATWSDMVPFFGLKR